MTWSGESNEEKDAWLARIWLCYGVTRMVTILNGKPLTRHYGYGFPAGINMATHTRDYNRHKTHRFTLTCTDHYLAHSSLTQHSGLSVIGASRGSLVHITISTQRS